MIDETSLMQRLKPHPNTAELGVWLSRDEISDLLDGVHKDGLDRQEELDDLRRENEDIESHLTSIESGVSRIIEEIKGQSLIKPENIASELAEVLP